MRPILVCLLLGTCAAGVQGASPQEPKNSYRTTKTLADLQKCLTDKLSERGDVTAVNVAENSVTLVFRDLSDGPMMIDLEPPSVTVTTRYLYGTRHVVKSCL